MLESTRAIPWKIDWATATFEYIGPQIEALLGWTPSSWLTVQDWADRMHPDDREHVVNFCVSQSQAGVDHEADYRALTASGGYVWIRDVVHVVRDGEGNVQSLVGFMFDITERKQTEERLLQLQHELEDLSFRDGLTGVSNRRKFDAVLHAEWLDARREVEAAERRVASLEEELQSVSALVRVDQLTEALNRRGFDELFKRESVRALRSGQTLSLALLDLDDFRHINAAHGHLGGDAALCHVVAMARATLRASDAVARFGGEEFVLLLPDTSFLEATGTLERLRARLAHSPLVHEGRGILVTFSAGVARWLPGESQDELLARADRAMYQAKQAGKNRVVAVER